MSNMRQKAFGRRPSSVLQSSGILLYSSRQLSEPVLLTSADHLWAAREYDYIRAIAIEDALL